MEAFPKRLRLHVLNPERPADVFQFIPADNGMRQHAIGEAGGAPEILRRETPCDPDRRFFEFLAISSLYFRSLA